LTPSGKFKYDAVFGRRSLKDGEVAEALEKDAVCFMASCKWISGYLFFTFEVRRALRHVLVAFAMSDLSYGSTA